MQKQSNLHGFCIYVFPCFSRLVMYGCHCSTQTLLMEMGEDAQEHAQDPCSTGSWTSEGSSTQYISVLSGTNPLALKRPWTCMEGVRRGFSPPPIGLLRDRSRDRTDQRVRLRPGGRFLFIGGEQVALPFNILHIYI